MKTAVSYSRVSKEDDSQDWTRQQEDILESRHITQINTKQRKVDGIVKIF